MLTVDAVRADVASLLHVRPDELLDSDNLFEYGLDSIRLATLVERWREAGAEVSFAELAEAPTLAGWLRLLQGIAGGGHASRLTVGRPRSPAGRAELRSGHVRGAG